MTSSFWLTLVTAPFCAVLALLAPLRSRQKLASRFFMAGMLLFAANRSLEAVSIGASSAESAAAWETAALLLSALIPGVWFCFSVTYARGNFRVSVGKSWLPLVITAGLPVGLAVGFSARLVTVLPPDETAGPPWVQLAFPGRLLNALLVLGAILILMNLERTLRSAVGTVRWRVKFLLLGLGVIFAIMVYAGSQKLIFPGNHLPEESIETTGLLVGCLLIVVSFFRGAFSEVDVYPSRAILHTSLTVLVAGSYLLIVGVLAETVGKVEPAGSFQLQAFFLLIGGAALSVVLLSDKFQQQIQTFVGRHFRRPEHDVRAVWALFTDGLSGYQRSDTLSAAVAKLLSETFRALSTFIWLVDHKTGRLFFAASTSGAVTAGRDPAQNTGTPGPAIEGLERLTRPFDLDLSKEAPLKELRKIGHGQFQNGGHRMCVPLRAGDQLLGVAILADRVRGQAYSIQEMDLLECIGGQVGAALLNLKRSAELTIGKELEAFESVSAFFVHDLKNAASTLRLMLNNLPVHFGDPAFQEDAVRGVRSAVERIDRLIARGNALRPGLKFNFAPTDLNALVAESLKQVDGRDGVRLIETLQPVPPLSADREQLQGVVVNLLLNAADAVGNGGVIRVETGYVDGWAQFLVTDDGAGMSSDFIQESLFRPFCTTKPEGLGIGLFQSKMIIEAHHGKLLVNSEVGVGTTFCARLPVNR